MLSYVTAGVPLYTEFSNFSQPRDLILEPLGTDRNRYSHFDKHTVRSILAL